MGQGRPRLSNIGEDLPIMLVWNVNETQMYLKIKTELGFFRGGPFKNFHLKYHNINTLKICVMLKMVH